MAHLLTLEGVRCELAHHPLETLFALQCTYVAAESAVDIQQACIPTPMETRFAPCILQTYDAANGRRTKPAGHRRGERHPPPLGSQRQGSDGLWRKIDALPEHMAHVGSGQAPPHGPAAPAPVLRRLLHRLQAQQSGFLQRGRAAARGSRRLRAIGCVHCGAAASQRSLGRIQISAHRRIGSDQVPKKK